MACHVNLWYGGAQVDDMAFLEMYGERQTDISDISFLVKAAFVCFTDDEVIVHQTGGCRTTG